MEKLSVADYFKRPETMYPMELVYGVVREPPAPRYGHQSMLTRLAALLYEHVRTHDLGQIAVAPVDVVLDEPSSLVVQPDIVFVARARLHTIRDRIWGAPDLVVEVLSPRTARYDRTTKLGWNERYGVAECWLVDAGARSIEVADLTARPKSGRRFDGDTPMVSRVLPGWNAPASATFGF